MIYLLALLSSSISYFPHEEKSFITWMHENNVIFIGEEYHFRFGIFLSNLRFIKEHNTANRKYKIGLNKFAASTPSEYRSHLQMKVISNIHKAPSTQFPDSFDWRDKGVVNPIRDQGYCYSDYAIFSTFLAESSNAITSGNLLTYSVQNIVDCADSCYGCDGGYLSDALSYIIKKQNGHFNLESDYPYTGFGTDCKFDEYEKYGSLTDSFQVQITNNTDLASTIVTYGPVGTSIDSLDWTFAMYSGGIYNEHVCLSYEPRDVGVVGYGTEENVFYWILRLSFGTAWGEEGYMRMHRSDLCVLSKSVIVVVS